MVYFNTQHCFIYYFFVWLTKCVVWRITLVPLHLVRLGNKVSDGHQLVDIFLSRDAQSLLVHVNLVVWGKHLLTTSLHHIMFNILECNTVLTDPKFYSLHSTSDDPYLDLKNLEIHVRVFLMLGFFKKDRTILQTCLCFLINCHHIILN